MDKKNISETIGSVIGEVMADMNTRWQRQAKYNEWDKEQIKNLKHKFLFGRSGKLWRYRSEWDLSQAYVWNRKGHIHMSYGITHPEKHKRMSVKVQRKIIELDEEITKLRMKQQRILAIHYNKAKVITARQIYNQAQKIKELKKQYGIE